MNQIRVLPGLIIAYGWGGILFLAAWVFSLVLIIVPFPDKIGSIRERLFRRTIHILAFWWVTILGGLGVLRVNLSVLRSIPHRRGIVLVANHPTYLDVILFLAVIPDLLCLTKFANFKAFWIASMAQQAGYVDNQRIFKMVRQCVHRLRKLENFLIFPEGTRTEGREIGPLKRGFAAIAIQARAPIRIIRIHSKNESFMRKGKPFFSFCSRLPLEYHLEDLGIVRPSYGENSRSITELVERRLRGSA